MAIKALYEGAKVFLETWTKSTPPSPFGEQLRSSTLKEKMTTLWKGYHVTQKNKVEEQIQEGTFQNRDQHIYWYPFLLKNGGDQSVFLFGGKQKGCWTSDDPVLLKIGSNKMWRWNDIYRFPFFPASKDQNVKILDAWMINPKWVEARRMRIVYPTLTKKICLSFQKGREAFSLTWSKT